MTIRIKWLNPVFSEISSKDYKEIERCLSYVHTWWTKGQYKKERQEGMFSVGSKIKGKPIYLIHSGLLPRVRKFCVENELPYEISGERGHMDPQPTVEPKVEGMTLREDQLELIQIACTERRGTVVAPTRTGKTVVMMGFVSRFPTEKILILCDRTSIVSQTKKKFDNAGFKKVAMMAAGKKNKARITIASVQSFIRTINPKEYDHSWDIVIVDEAHKVSKFEGQYAQVLESVTAPIRLGFTATLPTRPLAQLALEAMIGPKIGELTPEEAVELGLMMQPKIRVLKTPYAAWIRDIRRYEEVYENGIVGNRTRHRLVLEQVKKYLEEGKTVLVLVRKIRHGRMLQAIGEIMGLEIEYIHGGVGLTIRDEVQAAFNERKVKCVIATAAWKEGIDIPTLDVVFNAAGGKDELPTIQSVSRCLTVAENKPQAIIHDVFDPSHPYLVDHFGHRVSLYTERGWL